MSKAEDLALEKYPQRSVLVVPARGGGYYADSHLREGFIDGYHQAEKDLELGWEDIRTILDCFIRYKMEIGWNKTIDEDDCAKEVLKRFNKERKEK